MASPKTIQTEPKVSCVMLVCGRPEMTARAVRCFEAQTYDAKELIRFENAGDRSIGKLRNEANALARGEIICHFDSDDYSHPNRIAEQVAHLQSSGADVVGYNELLFWRDPIIEQSSTETASSRIEIAGIGQAWIYKNVRADLSPGTSLCYWRRTWERKPFPDTSHGEDRIWMQGLNVAAVSSMPDFTQVESATTRWYEEPALIASIHGSNSENYDMEEIIRRGGETNWRRAPEWDDYCRNLEGMKL